ncbi:Anaerobic selenocysteine-containing dehydrogenase [Sphingopyxis sp. YR583]|uniref:molybdopterin-containing oxidoreductase family protein n=1 Tax=Sphingopyxis sp. YR583 TaxID=1881047 RepID=UPI0008A7D45E|nr:molybdopterin-dependent oxidoreductase [Sphingopyxis sp. YR583]SEH19235.1 Anaerobic selenocysteine-containing dehydrogenase [Sphingopyxis sp. YR583]
MVEVREAKSSCRICIGTCGVRLTVEDGRVTQVRGDKDHVLSRGYACIKGLGAADAMNAPDRILHPMKRNADGGWEQIPFEQALDEIAERMGAIIAEEGPESAALFKGTQAYLSVSAAPMLEAFQRAIGSPSFFTTMTIDQSAKFVGMNRIGMWGAPMHHFHDAEVLMLCGGNPLVSLSVQGVIPFNMTKQFRDAKARGMKLIVIDPRVTETAQMADIHLQVRPGEDPTLMAGILREILAQGFEDKAFCRDYVAELEDLRRSLDPFTLDYTAARAGVPAKLVAEAARMFAADNRIGSAFSSTGPNMAARSNLAEHLIQVLNILCGRFMRGGEKLRNPGVINPLWLRPPVAEVIPALREFETGPRSRVRGIGAMFGEMMSGTLPEEILTPGKGRIRSLLVTGANPAIAMPDQIKTVEALKALDLLVVVEPFPTATTELAHYVIPPKLLYEREDVLMTPAYEGLFMPVPYQRYCPPVVSPPEGSEVVDEWRVYWGLAQRLGKQIIFEESALDMVEAPTTRDLIALVMRHSPISIDELASFPDGKIFEGLPDAVVQPGETGTKRFTVMPPDVATDMAEMLADDPARLDADFPFRLISRRMRESQNSFGRNFPAVRERFQYNPAFMNPADMEELGLAAGDAVEIVSPRAAIEGRVRPEPSLRRGVVSMAHCWGGLPDKELPYDEGGSNTARLVSLDEDCEAVNHMPRMSAIPVRISPAPPVTPETTKEKVVS